MKSLDRGGRSGRRGWLLLGLEPNLTLSMGTNTRCGVLDQILGLRKDQLAREPKRKTLPGWASWCSGARTVFALVLSLTASYVIERPSAAIADRVGFHRLRGVLLPFASAKLPYSRCCNSRAKRGRGPAILCRARPCRVRP